MKGEGGVKRAVFSATGLGTCREGCDEQSSAARFDSAYGLIVFRENRQSAG
jgi:hypothetical protein